MNTAAMKEWIGYFRNFMNERGSFEGLLILDNLSSHITREVVDLLIENGVHAFPLPPRCVDELSPCDNCFFAQFRRRFNEKDLSIDKIEKLKQTFDELKGDCDKIVNK